MKKIKKGLLIKILKILLENKIDFDTATGVIGILAVYLPANEKTKNRLLEEGFRPKQK